MRSAVAGSSRPARGRLRDQITAGELLAPALSSGGPVHNDYFMPIGAPAPAKHTLRGTFTVPASSVAAARGGCAAIPWATPAGSIAFFTHGEYLVPVVRDFVPPGGALLVSPGRVWSEPGDGGMSRASSTGDVSRVERKHDVVHAHALVGPNTRDHLIGIVSRQSRARRRALAGGLAAHFHFHPHGHGQRIRVPSRLCDQLSHFLASRSKFLRR